MKLVDNVTVLNVITSLPIPVERVLSEAMKAEPQIAIVIGQDKDGALYFASSEADGGTVLWWMEKAKRALMEISE
jgi:hypothetical protein